MNRAYSRNQLEEVGFDYRRYSFPKAPGRGTGTLVMKEWGKAKCLICYFDMDTGEKLALSVWWDSNPQRSYRPKQSDIDMSMVEIGTRMNICYELSSSGKSRFLEAKI